MTTKTVKPLGLTLKAAAELVGVDYRRIVAAVDDGTIPSIQIGERRMIPRAQLLRLFGVETGDGE